MAYQHILVPVDGSDISFSAVRHAAKIAKAFGSKLSLISLIAEDPFTEADFYYSSTIMKEYFAQAHANAKNALKESDGSILSVTDEEILEAYQLLASTDGVFAEPASCATIAGIKKRLDAGLIEKGTTIVGVLTGNGLKDPETAIEVNEGQPFLSQEQFDTFLNELKAGAN